MIGRGYPPPAGAHATHLYFHPVPGQLVFAAALIIAALVVIGWLVLMRHCGCRRGA